MTSTVSPAPDTAAVVDRKSALRFVDAHIRPFADDYDSDGRVPDSVLDRLGRAGLMAPFLPAEVGGVGMDMATLGEVHEEVGRGCSSVRSLLTVHSMVAWAVNRWGSTDQRDRWSPALARGERLAAFCLSEPEAGSDTSAISTVATPCDEGWRITGVKKWITGGQRADLLLVFAKTEASIGAFLVPRETPGVVVTPIDDMLGTRASMLAEVELRDVRVGPDAVLGPLGFTAGMVLTGVLDIGRYSVAAGSVGIIQACLDACAAYTAERTAHGAALRDLPLIQAKLSDMITDVRAARALCAEAGRSKDAGDSATIMATWVAKYFASTAAAKHASEAVQIHGARGCAPRSAVARFYRDAKVMEIIEGSNEVQQTTIAGQADREVRR